MTSRPAPAPDDASGPDWPGLVRAGALIAVAALFVWLAFAVRLPDLATLRAWFEGYGIWGWLAFVALYAVVALTPIPVTIMAVLGGVVYGVLEGSVLSVAGAMVGSLGAYGIARLLGRATVMWLLGDRGAAVERRLGDAGFLAVLTLRVAPGIPYWPVNYAAGALGVPLRTFATAATLGSAPGQVSLVALGAFATRPGWATGVVVAASWVVVLVLTVWGARRWRRARHGSTDPAVGTAG